MPVDYSAPITADEILGCEAMRTVKPHPDGQPWTKCCCQDGPKTCAYADRNAYNRNRLDQSAFNYWPRAHVYAHGARFFCVHRKDGDFNRVCAGWHARDGWDKEKK